MTQDITASVREAIDLRDEISEYIDFTIAAEGRSIVKIADVRYEPEINAFTEIVAVNDEGIDDFAWVSYLWVRQSAKGADTRRKRYSCLLRGAKN